jgi:hypothetical protein
MIYDNDSYYRVYKVPKLNFNMKKKKKLVLYIIKSYWEME